MKARYLLTVLISLAIFFIWSCEKDLSFNEVTQEEAQLNLRGFTSANLSSSIIDWKHADVSATDKQEKHAFVAVGSDGTAHFVFIRETKSQKINGRWTATGFDLFYRNTTGGSMNEITQLTTYEAGDWGGSGIYVEAGMIHITFQVRTDTECGLFYIVSTPGKSGIWKLCDTGTILEFICCW